MKSLLILSLLIAAIWVSAIPTLYLINMVVYVIEASWLRSLVGVAVFGAWVALWYTLLRVISRSIIFSKFSSKSD